MGPFINKLLKAQKVFDVNLTEKTVLTEAATGNYSCTSLLAAMAGATVYAIGKDSRFGSARQAFAAVEAVAEKLKLTDKIHFVRDIDEVPLAQLDVVTNTGFVRPIDAQMISRLSAGCVVPLMWEPWEFRSSDINLQACAEKQILVYGTNESDNRLRTMEYLSFIVLHFLLKNAITPLGSKILIMGSEKFARPIEKALGSLGSRCFSNHEAIELSEMDALVLCEHEQTELLISDDPEDQPLILSTALSEHSLILHISGNARPVAKRKMIPEKPAGFGFMSFTTDYLDAKAVIDLHCAGLKVAEGMIAALEKKLEGPERKSFLEAQYPALAFGDKKLW